VQLVTADAHPGLVAAISSALPGAAWQRRRSHYLRTLLTKVPKSAQPHVATQVRTIFDQADATAVHTQFDRVVAALADKYPDAAEHLDDAREELLAWRASQIPDRGPNKVPSGMGVDGCRRNAENIVLSLRLRRRGW
jgi:transposase-like protein